jgi:hypothetical protein
MDVKEITNADPLTFWPQHKLKFPILYRVASIVLAIQPCSSGVERLFSLAGRTMPVSRAAMSGETLNMLTTLGSWLRNSGNCDDARAVKRQRRANKFATLVATENGLVLTAAAESETAEDLEVLEDESDKFAEELINLEERERYSGQILPCPSRVPNDLPETGKVAMYFIGYGWAEGDLVAVDRRFKNRDNISVMFFDGLYNFCASKDNYETDWVLLA